MKYATRKAFSIIGILVLPIIFFSGAIDHHNTIDAIEYQITKIYSEGKAYLNYNINTSTNY